MTRLPVVQGVPLRPHPMTLIELAELRPGWPGHSVAVSYQDFPAALLRGL
jgi:hypothetical protein